MKVEVRGNPRIVDGNLVAIDVEVDGINVIVTSAQFGGAGSAHHADPVCREANQAALEWASRNRSALDPLYEQVERNRSRKPKKGLAPALDPIGRVGEQIKENLGLSTPHKPGKK